MKHDHFAFIRASMVLAAMWIFLSPSLYAAAQDTVYFQVHMDEAASHEYSIVMEFNTLDTKEPYVDLSMPVWSPGYYQVMNFAQHVSGLEAVDVSSSENLRVIALDPDTWRVYLSQAARASGDAAADSRIRVQYKVRAERAFVGTAYLDTNRAFLKPAALFLYPEGGLERPIHIGLNLYGAWNRVATGLEPVDGSERAFTAADYDTLYDSPLLCGQLEELPPFYVNGVKHRFIGYAMGEFDGAGLMEELRSIVEASVDLIGGEIPYPHYTFIGIGPGRGGIEQLNSTAISFTGEGLQGPGRMAMLSFIAHEYFHHYNVKRIRPIELGPFDYSKPNRTNLLWVAEGLTVYYENVILKKAGLMTGEQILRDWESHINSHENNPGKFHQTLAESSAQTWEDGPFGKPGETISYYVKGPIIGMLLDLRIRLASENRYSLDDVMRHLYHHFYLEQGRGFTDREVMDVCEHYAGESLTDLFDYIYTTNAIDYGKHFGQAGLTFEWQEVTTAQGQVRQEARLGIAEDLSALQRTIIQDMFP